MQNLKSKTDLFLRLLTLCPAFSVAALTIHSSGSD